MRVEAYGANERQPRTLSDALFLSDANLPPVPAPLTKNNGHELGA